jgi:hypothetical protein
MAPRRPCPGPGGHTDLGGCPSGYLVPSNYWRAREVITAVSARGVPEARELADAYRAEIETGRARRQADDTRAALPVAFNRARTGRASADLGHLGRPRLRPDSWAP